MKKLITTLMIAIGINLADAQIKSTGTVTIPSAKPMTIKLDMYKGQNLLVMTLTGPADRLFCIAFNANTGAGAMNGSDSVTATKAGAYLQTGTPPKIDAGGNVLLDTKPFGGNGAIQVDAGVNDWTVIKDVSDLTTRTIVAARPLDTGDTSEDYKFDFDNLINLNLMWAIWRDATVAGSDDGMWSIAGKNSLNGSTRHNSGNVSERGYLPVTFQPTGGKSTGVVTLTDPTIVTAKPMTLKLDMDNANQRVFMTVTGPADRMFYIGLGGSSMATVTDAVAFTKLGACDQLAGTNSNGAITLQTDYIAPTGNAVLDTRGWAASPNDHVATTKDAVNDWIVISDDGDYPPTKATRTVLATRAFDTQSNEGDFPFDYNMASLQVIWAQGRDFAPVAAGSAGPGIATNPNSADNGYWALSGKNTVGVTTRHGGSSTGQRGTTTLTFADLGIADNAYSQTISVYPNPAKNIVNVLANSSSSISTIKIFDINAKLIKVVRPETITNDFAVDVSDLRKGIYFLEISNDHDRTVKKIIKE